MTQNADYGRRRVTNEEARSTLFERMLTAFRDVPDASEKAEWVLAGWPWWVDEPSSHFEWRGKPPDWNREGWL